MFVNSWVAKQLIYVINYVTCKINDNGTTEDKSNLIEAQCCIMAGLFYKILAGARQKCQLLKSENFMSSYNYCTYLR
jgi:hypothetical protein